jgi:hypothetical protein
MIPVETIPGKGEGRIKKNEGRHTEFFTNMRLLLSTALNG